MYANSVGCQFVKPRSQAPEASASLSHGDGHQHEERTPDDEVGRTACAAVRDVFGGDDVDEVAVAQVSRSCQFKMAEHAIGPAMESDGVRGWPRTLS